MMLFSDMLYSQGFGSRRVCSGLIQNRLVGAKIPENSAIVQHSRHLFATLFDIDSKLQLGEDVDIDVLDGMPFQVQGQQWQYQQKAYVLMHKPLGVECSAKPKIWPSVYSLLPAPLRQRPVRGGQDGVQAVGRLDQDTTGLLLLSDDGAFIHRMASPKHHVNKVYRVTCKHEISRSMAAQLVAGVQLEEPNGRPAIDVAAVACSQISEFGVELTISEGKYHQVKRMVAAAGNRCEALHRSHIGTLALPEHLKAGQWQWLSAADLAHLGYRSGG